MNPASLRVTVGEVGVRTRDRWKIIYTDLLRLPALPWGGSADSWWWHTGPNTGIIRFIHGDGIRCLQGITGIIRVKHGVATWVNHTTGDCCPSLQERPKYELDTEQFYGRPWGCWIHFFFDFHRRRLPESPRQQSWKSSSIPPIHFKEILVFVRISTTADGTVSQDVNCTVIRLSKRSQQNVL